MSRRGGWFYEWIRMTRHPVLLVWALYLVLTPFYLVRGGLPQPGDALILLLVPMALTIWNGRFPAPAAHATRKLFSFTIWVCVVNGAWAVILWRWGVNLLFPLYYVYNAAFFIAALVLYQRFGTAFLRFTVQLIFATVMFQVVVSPFVGSGVLRSKLFFHNPNQLGYYALLSACIIAMSYRRLRLSMVWTSVGLLGCGYLALLSTSRSSVGGIALLVVLLVVSDPRIFITASLAAVAITMFEPAIDHSVSALERRILEDRRPQHSFFEERGYDRIWNNKQHLLIGAGEGAPERFADSTAIGGYEIHSSAGTLLFSYGIAGVALFGMFLFSLLRGAGLRAGLMLLPPLFYSVAHQGLRFTMLWVLLALFVALKNEKETAT